MSPSPAPPRSGEDKAVHTLAIYLNDHLAGATAGTQLAGRIARVHARSPYGAEFARLAVEIAADRQALLEIMTSLGVPARQYKILAGRIGERAGMLKSNGRLVRRSGLSTVIELEGLRLGIEGKSLLWKTLLTAHPEDPRLDRLRLEDLLHAARRQIEIVEELRMRAVSRVFGEELRPAQGPATRLS
ncbi:hypothetical protein [Streptomyces meridianus]|uniref:Uncharacterized protein n=1 Tax=Streptomyces meridianus TaxID=2938945 RepID=A0ABT0XDR5_9ACTN|nr:hypothetical protein [Streptomyces meridianus]MCM2579919.1 hypothetical protein [Streptomyces meridianus]